jgi:hypothetical protein
VAIIHESMAGSARAIAMVSGMPDYEFVIVKYPHPPLAIWTPDEIDDIVGEVADQVRRRLTAAPEMPNGSARTEQGVASPR